MKNICTCRLLLIYPIFKMQKQSINNTEYHKSILLFKHKYHSRLRYNDISMDILIKNIKGAIYSSVNIIRDHLLCVNFSDKK